MMVLMDFSFYSLFWVNHFIPDAHCFAGDGEMMDRLDMVYKYQRKRSEEKEKEEAREKKERQEKERQERIKEG